MNNNGQTIFLGLMLATTLIILALAFAPGLKSSIDEARNVSNPNNIANLDCTNTSISSVNKLTCVVTDLSLFQFIGGLIFLAGIIITARIIF